MHSLDVGNDSPKANSKKKEEETSILDRIAEGKRRETALVVVGLAIVLLLAAAPIAAYIWKPAQDLKSESAVPLNESNSTEVFRNLPKSQCAQASLAALRSSICSGYLYWLTENQSQVSNNSTISIKQWNCTVSDIEENLRKLFGLLVFTDFKCAENAKVLICNLLYNPCERYQVNVTREDCIRVRDGYCPTEWSVADAYLKSTPGDRFCITLPNCESLPTSSSRQKNFLKIPTFRVNQSRIALQNETCPSPLIPSQSSTARCSPECLAENWASKEERIALDVMLNITVIFNWICIVVLITTWIAVPSLVKFPQIILLFMTVSYAIAVFGLNLPLFVGRKEAYCSHPDALTVWEDPSTICKVQGILIHFGIVSAMLWWLCSVFNIFIAVRSVSMDHFIVTKKKLLLVSETLFSIGIPALLVMVVLLTEGHYTTNSVEIIACTPPTSDLLFFTLSLPLQISTFTGIAMVIFIIIRIRKINNIHKERRFTTAHSARVYQSLQQRFLFLAVLCPFSFSVIMTSVCVYSRLSTQILNDYFEYVSCLAANGETNCDHPFKKYRSVTFTIIDLLMFCLFSYSISAYIMAPRAAREFWKKTLMSAKRACFKQRKSSPSVPVSEDVLTTKAEQQQTHTKV